MTSKTFPELLDEKAREAGYKNFHHLIACWEMVFVLDKIDNIITAAAEEYKEQVLTTIIEEVECHISYNTIVQLKKNVILIIKNHITPTI